MMDREEIMTPDEAGGALPTEAPAGPALQDATPSAAPEEQNEDNAEHEDIDELESEEVDEEDEVEEDDMDDEDEYNVWEDEFDEEETCDHEPRPKRKKSKPMASLLHLAERGILKQLSKAVDGQRVTARYCCGGRVRALPPAALPLQDEKQRKVPRLTLRWDDSMGRRGRKVHFPHTDEPPRKFESQVVTLADRCWETGLLDGSKFSIDFDPHFFGIIDVISQILLPGFDSEILKDVPEQRGIRAKLSNLQIRSPGGNQDIPLDRHRWPTYFGKLVVCLPYAHQGGQWDISSDGHTTIFDWSKAEDVTTVQWVAFVGDCAHHCQPIKEGHQIVLTYNLFLTPRVGDALRDNSTSDPALFPLYAGVKEMLEHPGFMKKGGTLGFYCQYSYPHVKPNAANQFPTTFQGVDMVVYSVFQSLGLKIDILPLLDLTMLNYYEESEYERQAECHDDDPYTYYDLYGDGDDDIPACSCCIPDFPTFKEWKAQQPHIDHIGTKLHGLQFTQSSEEAEWDRDEKDMSLQDVWPWKEYTDIKWLNGSEKAPGWDTPQAGSRWQLALVNSNYEGSPEKFYSHLIMLITVPKMVDRNLNGAK